jgi:hypothetical protein
VKQQLDGAVDSLHSRKGDKFNIYPVALVVKLLAAHSPSKVDAATLDTVRAFVQKQQQQQQQLLQVSQPLVFGAGTASSAAASAQRPVAMDLDDASVPSLEAAGMVLGLGLGLASGSAAAASAQGSHERKDQASLAASEEETKVKLEPGLRSSRCHQPRYLPVSSFLSGIPVIDLTHPATLAALSHLEDDDDGSKERAEAATADVEQTLSSLLDNFSLWHPRMEEYAVLREHGLRPQEVSVLLQEQCQRFSEYRQEIWNWHRDPNQVTPRTVGNNIRVFLLFGGFVCHSAKRHRLKPAAFDMSVFGSKHIEPYIMDFLQVRGCLSRDQLTTLCVFAVFARFAQAHVLLHRQLHELDRRSGQVLFRRQPARQMQRPSLNWCRSRSTRSGSRGRNASRCVVRVKRRTKQHMRATTTSLRNGC